MLERIRYILAVAAEQKADHLVLGAFGCGVFRNDPAEVAGWFRQIIAEENYGTAFQRIIFAVLDKSPDERVIRPFRQEFIS
jgi:uncharacterized protein (TIGR02452 family)